MADIRIEMPPLARPTEGNALAAVRGRLRSAFAKFRFARLERVAALANGTGTGSDVEAPFLAVCAEHLNRPTHYQGN